jgi:hypothetical protein
VKNGLGWGARESQNLLSCAAMRAGIRKSLKDRNYSAAGRLYLGRPCAGPILGQGGFLQPGSSSLLSRHYYTDMPGFHLLDL